MAKVTANGDEPVRTWYGPHNRRMVWTRRGRLLMRYAGTRRYTVLRTNCSEQTAEQMAASQLMSRELV